MYVLAHRGGYNRHDEQVAAGWFLLVASDRNNNLFTAVRFVRMVQCGHFMMGTARIANESITVSGTYGSDGLPLDYDRMSDAVKAHFTPLSAEDAYIFWHGTGGHNSAGSEGMHMKKIGRSMAIEYRKRYSRQYQQGRAFSSHLR